MLIVYEFHTEPESLLSSDEGNRFLGKTNIVQSIIKCLRSAQNEYELEFFQDTKAFDIVIDQDEEDEYWGTLTYDSPEDGYMTATTNDKDGISIDVMTLRISDDHDKLESDVERIIYQLLRVMRKYQ